MPWTADDGSPESPADGLPIPPAGPTYEEMVARLKAEGRRRALTAVLDGDRRERRSEAVPGSHGGDGTRV